MSLAFKNYALPPLTGEVVVAATADEDHNGYGYVELRFASGVVLRVMEVSQVGQIEWKVTDPK